MGIRFRPRVRFRTRKRQSLGCLLFQLIGIAIFVGLIWLAARLFELYATGG